MCRRAAAAILMQSPAVVSFFAARVSPLNSFRRHRLHLSRSGSSCSSPNDDLDGLIDPDRVPPWNGESRVREDHQEASVSVSMKDFSFLKEPVVEDRDCLSGKSPNKGAFSAEAVLIAEAVRASGSVHDDKTEKILRQFRGKLNQSLVIEVLTLIKDRDLALRFFIWAGQQIGYRHTGGTYDALIEILGFDKKNRIPQHFLREIGQEDREVLGRLLNVLVKKCCLNGFWNEALEELGRLKDFGYKPSKVTYNALLRVLLSAGRLDSALLLYREMSDSEFCVEMSTMGSFAYSLCKAGKWVEALNIVEAEDFTLDTVLCTQMISGMLEASLFEEAMRFLHRMRSNSCVPNVVTYRTLLSGFIKKKQFGWCKRIINMMITEGCNPTPSLFNSLMHGYCSIGDYAYAYKLLKKMNACGCQPGYLTYNIFIGGICGNRELPSSDVLEMAANAYKEMLNAGFVLNKINVINFAQCLCHMEKFDKAFQIIKEMMKKGFIPDNNTYTSVIGILCQANKVEKAFLLFQEMKKNDVVPDVYTYTIMIDTFCKVGLIEQAWRCFEEMQKDGCTPSVATYTALIHAYLKAKQLPKAIELFKSMSEVGCVPNVVTYTALIDGLCKAGEVEEACNIYAKMQGICEDTSTNNYFEGETGEILEPNVFTYGALVDGLCKAHKVVEARQLLDSMLSSGCEPNNVVYDALIDGFCKVGKLDDAQEVFIRMSERGYTPTVYTYSALIDRMFKDKRFDLALKVLSKMLENSCAPNVVTYTEMIDGLCKVGKTEQAYQLLLMMEEKGCDPNVVTYTALIDGFGKASEINMCLELFRRMVAKGCAPNLITYRVLINHCCTAGLLDDAYKLLEEMKQTYWPKHVSGYRDVIQGFSKEFLNSLGLLDEITNYDPVPIAPTYCILIDSFFKAGKLEKALELHKEIEGDLSCSSVANKNMYSSVIQGLCSASNIEKAFEMYSQMIRRGCVPELMVFFCLIKGLLKVNKWNEALQLLYSTYHMGIKWHGEETSKGG